MSGVEIGGSYLFGGIPVVSRLRGVYSKLRCVLDRVEEPAIRGLIVNTQCDVRDALNDLAEPEEDGDS